MDYLSNPGIFFLLSLLVAMATAKISSFYVSNITFNQSGYPTQESLPNCTGDIITLSSYSYLYRDDAGLTASRALSAVAERTIHKMCSLKRACGTRKFPVEDFSGHEAVLEVKYRCLDNYETFVDICDNTEKESYTIIHLVIRKKSLSQSICQCTVTGKFHLNLTDVRLMSSVSNDCSNAELVVPQHVYGCKSSNENFGSVFRKSLGKILELGTISYTSNSESVTPEMVYLTLSPKGTVRLSCGTKSGDSKNNSVTKPITLIQITENDLKEKDSSQTTTVVVVICLCVTLVLVCLLVIRSRRKKWSEIELTQLQRLLKNRLSIEQATQPAVNPSAGNNAKQVSNFMDEDGEYIGLQERGAVTVVAGNEKHINETSSETSEAAYSTYDHLNTQTLNPGKASNEMQRKQDSRVYSYADARPRKRKTSNSVITTGHKIDHQTQETGHVGKTSLSKDSSWHCDDHLSKKHTYVSLMPAQKSAARCDCEKCLNLPIPIHQKDTRVPRADNNKKQDSRKYGVLKPSKINNSAMMYSYATDPLENRPKMATAIPEKLASKNEVGNDRETPLSKLHLETASGEAYHDIEMDKPNILDDTEYDKTTQNPKWMHNASKYDHIQNFKAQGPRSIENIDIDKATHKAMPRQFYKSVPVQRVTDAKHILAQEQSPISSALKGNTTNSTDFSDDEHYDKMKDEFTTIQKHPNYGRLATRVRSSFLSIFQKK